MEKNGNTVREKKTSREGRSGDRRIKIETTVILVIAAFVSGLVVGAITALLKTPSPMAARQTVFSDQGTILPTERLDPSPKMRRLEEVLQKDPEDFEGWVQLGDLFYQSQRYEKAVEAYANALNLQPSSPEVLKKIGNAHFDRGAYEEAIEFYSKALSINPKNPDVLTDLGVAYRRTKRPDKALDAFRAAAEADATHSMSRYNQGVVLFHDLNDTEGAIAVWEEFLQIEPSGERAERVRSMVETLRAMSSGHPARGSDR